VTSGERRIEHQQRGGQARTGSGMTAAPAGAAAADQDAVMKAS
jgi:hypothetical protein